MIDTINKSDDIDIEYEWKSVSSCLNEIGGIPMMFDNGWELVGGALRRPLNYDD